MLQQVIVEQWELKYVMF
jgi:hypothetical protein